MKLLTVLLLVLAPSGAGTAEGSYLKGLEAGKAGDFARAEQLFQEALAADPRHIPSKRALDLLADRSVAVVQDATAVLLFNGMSLQAQDDWTGAEGEYRKAVERDPTYYLALHNLAVARYRAGDDATAIELYQKALEGKPDHAYTHNDLGLAYARTGQHEKACEHYRKALDIDPNYYKAYNNLAVSLTALGKKQEADELLKRALELNPGYALAAANLAPREPSPSAPEAGGESMPTSALIDLLESGRWEERTWATDRLRERNDPEAVPRLLELLKAERPEVRSAAALVLGGARNPRALEALAFRLLHDKDWVVRFELVAALAQSRDPLAVEPLIKALAKDADPHVRRNAASWLRVYPGCATARALKKALKDSVSEVRQAAADSLAALSGQDPAQDPKRLAQWVVAVCAQESTTGER